MSGWEATPSVYEWANEINGNGEGYVNRETNTSRKRIGKLNQKIGFVSLRRVLVSTSSASTSSSAEMEVRCEDGEDDGEDNEVEEKDEPFKAPLYF